MFYKSIKVYPYRKGRSILIFQPESFPIFYQTNAKKYVAVETIRS